MERVIEMRARQSAELAGTNFIEGVAEVASKAAVRFFNALARVGEARAKARMRRDLQQLSDHMLKDIGLERSDIDSLYR